MKWDLGILVQVDREVDRMHSTLFELGGLNKHEVAYCCWIVRRATHNSLLRAKKQNLEARLAQMVAETNEVETRPRGRAKETRPRTKRHDRKD